MKVVFLSWAVWRADGRRRARDGKAGREEEDPVSRWRRTHSLTRRGMDGDFLKILNEQK